MRERYLLVLSSSDVSGVGQSDFSIYSFILGKDFQ